MAGASTRSFVANLELSALPVADLVQEQDTAIVHRVPLEILRAIFTLVQGRVTFHARDSFQRTVTIPDAYYTFLTATRVCRRWHHIITGSPEFWTTICLPHMRSETSLQLALRYSGNAPLRVVYNEYAMVNESSVSMDDAVGMQKMLRNVLVASDRVSELYAQIAVVQQTIDTREETTRLLRGPFPALRTFHLFFSMSPITLDPDADVDFALSSDMLPALEELRIRDSSDIHWEGLRTLSKLRVLDVTSNEAVAPHLETLLQVLHSMPYLEVLRMDLPHIEDDLSQQENRDTIPLDVLRALQITGERSMCTRLIQHLRVSRPVFLGIKYPPRHGSNASNVVEPLLSIIPQQTRAAPLLTLALSINVAHYHLCGWERIIPEDCGMLSGCNEGAAFKLDVGWGWDESLIEAAGRLPITDVRELILRPWSYASQMTDPSADLALSTVSMPHVESLWLYPTSVATVNQWMIPLSTPTETTGKCPWPALKTLVFRNTRYDDEQLVVDIRDALMKREAHGCSRLERLVILRSIFTERSIGLLRPFAEQVVLFENRAALPDVKFGDGSLYEEFEPLLL